MFNKKNIISKLWLKFTDKKSYKIYKWELKNYHHKIFHLEFTGSNRINSLNKIKKILETRTTLNINHSGNAGDIIYALPTIKKIFELTGANINLYLKLDQPLVLTANTSHPLGNVMLNQKMVDLLTPLLLKQKYISTVENFSADEIIHIDLDFFRSEIFPLDRGNIARWCSYTTGVSPDLWKKWIDVTPNQNFKNVIIIARSSRHQNTTLNFSFLSQYKDIQFVGVASEFLAMKEYIPDIKWLEVVDFLELAEIIAGCKFFIGNQSFPFSIAEGLKVPRILESSFEIINVVPEGENGHDVLFQDHFESLVHLLAGNNN